MNAKKVLNKIVEFLSANEVELTYAKLADGTIVESATFDVGEDLFVVSEDGTKSPAPNGFHDLMLKDEEGKENLIKVKTEDGKIVERENVELADEKVKDIPQDGTYTEDDKVPDVPGQIEKGTLKAAEETEEVEKLPESEDAELKPEDEKPEIEIELGKKLEKMAYRIEEMEKKIQKMEEAMLPPVDEEVDEEVAMEEEELPKLDGAPIDEATKFSTELNRKNYGKKSKDAQSSFLSKLYK
tara:strand:- start:141 stop:863 length:723 start_codon:yes stop_codon:yes gene_type:complete